MLDPLFQYMLRRAIDKAVDETVGRLWRFAKSRVVEFTEALSMPLYKAMLDELARPYSNFLFGPAGPC